MLVTWQRNPLQPANKTIRSCKRKEMFTSRKVWTCVTNMVCILRCYSSSRPRVHVPQPHLHSPICTCIRQSLSNPQSSATFRLHYLQPSSSSHVSPTYVYTLLSYSGPIFFSHSRPHTQLRLPFSILTGSNVSTYVLRFSSNASLAIL